jgi:pimeloyl-ACP methyl ester carboxylesterase
MNIYKSQEGARLVQERYREFLRRWPVPNQQLRVPTREGETFVVACGPEDAPSVLLFHGAGANAAMWMGDAASWSAHFRLYSVDVIGEPGLSAPSRPPLHSEAHALWLDDVLSGLALSRTSLVGISLGGWLALDYATRRPGRVESIALLCPGGLGRPKVSLLLKSTLLNLLGERGRNKLLQIALGPLPQVSSPGSRAFGEFSALILHHFRYRKTPLPIFSDEALESLTMPVLAILGGRDAILDSYETRERLRKCVPHAEISFLPEFGHLLVGQTARILEFLKEATAAQRGPARHQPLVPNPQSPVR